MDLWYKNKTCNNKKSTIMFTLEIRSYPLVIKAGLEILEPDVMPRGGIILSKWDGTWKLELVWELV